MGVVLMGMVWSVDPVSGNVGIMNHRDHAGRPWWRRPRNSGLQYRRASRGMGRLQFEATRSRLYRHRLYSLGPNRNGDIFLPMTVAMNEYTESLKKVTSQLAGAMQIASEIFVADSASCLMDEFTPENSV